MGIFDLFKQGWMPGIIPINREEDYHTHYLGKTGDGRQFFGYETFAFPDRMSRSNWQNHRIEYVVLYLFDSRGNHLETQHWYAGRSAEANARVNQEKLQKMVEALGPIEFCNIRVKPFQTLIDGIVFGLVPNEESQSIDLQPGSTISFQEPWDGEYYT